LNSASPSRVLTAFIALAVLGGPITSLFLGPGGIGSDHLGPAGTALASGAAGAALLGFAALRRERYPRGIQWLALLVLLVPQWLQSLLTLPGIRGLSVLHGTPWGVAFLVALAAPLWLGLLAALQLVRDDAPRAVAGASIAGIGAVCLATPGGAYAITQREIPVAALHILLGVLVVLSWEYARPRLHAATTTATAGCFLLLNALGSFVTIPLAVGTPPAPQDWRAAALSLLLTALLNAAIWWLWFWLLQRMTLAAFGMRSLALWTASILPGIFVYGLQASWRIDAALLIAFAALVTALRARTADEQPLALGLADP